MLKTFHQLSCVLVGLGVVACTAAAPESEGDGQQSFVEDLFDEIPNNAGIPNAFGLAATYSTTGTVDLNNAFFTPQGTNGRHCGTCHAPELG